MRTGIKTILFCVKRIKYFFDYKVGAVTFEFIAFNDRASKVPSPRRREIPNFRGNVSKAKQI